jgi:hypothetical protein
MQGYCLCVDTVEHQAVPDPNKTVWGLCDRDLIHWCIVRIRQGKAYVRQRDGKWSEQRAESKEQRAESREQRAES